MPGELEKYASEINAAHVAVEKAMQAYSKGGTVSAVNAANARLAAAHSQYRECSGNRLPDRR